MQQLRRKERLPPHHPDASTRQQARRVETPLDGLRWGWGMLFTVDLELTNRCNADCQFCPRDATPHQGRMRSDVFDQTLSRIVEFRDVIGGHVVVSLCGLGEPLLHRDAAACVARIRAAGLGCVMSTNGALLDDRHGQDLVAAGLQGIFVNVGATEDDYERVYGLPFERTRDNVVRFVRSAGDRCPLAIVLVDFHGDPDRTAALQDFWRDRGIGSFVTFELINRGGALAAERGPFGDFPEPVRARALLERTGGEARCSVPFEFPFIGYDGQYHLCASDWRRAAPLGSVFDRSIASVTTQKLALVRSREPVCRQCSLDPLNRLDNQLRSPGGVAEQQETALVDALEADRARADPMIRALLDASADAQEPESLSRKRIPVRAAEPA